MSTHYYLIVIKSWGKMRRKIVKNKHQFKLSVPIELVRKLGLDDKDNNSIIIKEVITKHGPGFVVLKDNEEILEVKDGIA